MSKEKIFIISGEDSGDLHGAKLIASIKQVNPNTEFFGIGGNRMQKQGLQLTEHIKNLNVIGIFEVVKHYSRIKKIFNNTISEIKKINPDKIVLIDYPGFNLRLAKKLSALNINITYFILPQVWAWKESRAKTLQQYCNKLISIIPFEQKWFSQKNITVHYAGHPLSELSDLTFDRGSFCQRHGIPEENKIIILMPGSRSVEIKRHWKIFENAVKNLRKQHQNLSFVLLEGDNVSISSSVNLVKIKENQYEAIGIADAAIVCSGTATLETAMLRCPMIVCYKLSWPTWILAQMLSKVKYLSLVNLIAEDKVVDEYLQNKMTAKNLASGVNNLFKNENRDTVVEKYKRLIEKLKTNENIRIKKPLDENKKEIPTAMVMCGKAINGYKSLFSLVKKFVKYNF